MHDSLRSTESHWVASKRPRAIQKSPVEATEGRDEMWKATSTGRMLAWDELARLDRLGGSIRARRVELGWTQSELADRSGVPQADISRIENERLDARWSTLQRLLSALAGSDAPRRSRANGRRVKDTPAPSAKWAPSKPRARIQRSST